MKLAVIGAGGNVGSRIVAEALRRGHTVTSLGRKDADHLAERVAAHDAVVSSVRFVDSDPHVLIDAVRRSGVKRYLVVGGAGSLESSGKLVVESPNFPEAARAESTRGVAFLEALKNTADDLEWTMLSPSANFVAGERTGKFRLGGDTLLTGADGKSWISYEDFAIALLDEIEKPVHVRGRFTIGY
jgi:uncharacterized protein